MKRIRLNESQFNRLVKNCVKKALNEAEVGNNGKTYHLCRVKGYSAENTYSEGENPSTEQYWDESSNIKGSSIQEVVNKFIKERIGDSKDVYVGIFEDSVRVQYLADEDGLVLTEKELQQWKQGQIKAYSYEYILMITTNVSQEELDKCGYEIWG